MKWKNIPFLLLGSVIFLLASCIREKSPQEISVNQIAEMQKTSLYGPEQDWGSVNLSWSTKIKKMRDSASRYCLLRHAPKRACQEEQDQAIRTAAEVDSIYQQVIADPYPPKDPDRTRLYVKLNPERYRQAVNFCFHVYEEAGSADARSLGPCMAAIAGLDYFDIWPHESVFASRVDEFALRRR